MHSVMIYLFLCVGYAVEV